MRRSDYFRPEIMFMYIKKLHRVKVKLTLCFYKILIRLLIYKEVNFLAGIEQHYSLILPAITTAN